MWDGRGAFMITNPYVSKTWVDRDTQYPTRRLLTYIDEETQQTKQLQVTVTRDEGTITEQGDAFAAAVMNNFEGRINTAVSALSACGFVEVSGTLTTGSTSITLSDASIFTTSTIDVFTDAWGVSPENVVVASGSVTMTFEAQASDLGVKVRVY